MILSCRKTNIAPRKFLSSINELKRASQQSLIQSIALFRKHTQQRHRNTSVLRSPQHTTPKFLRCLLMIGPSGNLLPQSLSAQHLPAVTSLLSQSRMRWIVNSLFLHIQQSLCFATIRLTVKKRLMAVQPGGRVSTQRIVSIAPTTLSVAFTQCYSGSDD